MKIFDQFELYRAPIDYVMNANREWREGIKQHDPKWTFVLLKHPDYNINDYIIKNYPELKEQFEWQQMTGNERMNRKFGHVKTNNPANHYAGGYGAPRYDPDLDPFFDQE